MQLDLKFEALTSSKLARLARLLEGLAESKRSAEFNRFLFWISREIEREIRCRIVGLPRRHIVSVDFKELRPGELRFLHRQLRDWQIEFGDYVIGPVAELFWHANASLTQVACFAALPI